MKNFLTAVMLVIASTVMAVPAQRVWKTVVQPDGSSLRVMLVGNAHCSYYVTQDYLPLCGNPVGGFRYASFSGRQLQPTPMLAHEPELRQAAEVNLTEQLHIQPDTERWQQQQSMRHVEQKDPQVLRGDRRGLIILVEFPDQKFSSDDPKQVYNEIANQPGYSQHGAQGSVHDYFSAQSGGLLNLTFDVVGPFTLQKSVRYYGERGEDLGTTRADLHAGEMIQEACLAADAHVDYSQYDWDGDNEVDQVFVLYAGYGEASGGPDYTVWPHEWTLTDAADSSLELDGTIVDTYACSAELSGDSGAVLNGIGTFCHEFSHCMGLPDMYDTNWRAFGMGDWDVMSHGSYNGGFNGENPLGWCPAGYTSYEKMYCGWQEPIELNSLGSLDYKPTTVKEMKPLSQQGEFYKIVNPGRPNEYYLLENRQKNGWDSELPASGLLILHVDYMPNPWRRNYVNSDADHQRVSIFHADNEASSGLPGELGDPYPFEGNDSLTDYSQPAATLFNNNIDGERLMHCAITGIECHDDGTVSFCFSKQENDESAISPLTAFSRQRPAYQLDGIQVRDGMLRQGITIDCNSQGWHKRIVRY